MELSDSILKHIREAVGLTEDNSEFDRELKDHINMSIVKLNQNGVKTNMYVKSEEETWGDLLDPDQIGFESSGTIPTFISLNVKLLFDPPPPSSVEFHTNSVNELLWRIRAAYDKEVEND